mgnify:CR=1 FL=1
MYSRPLFTKRRRRRCVRGKSLALCLWVLTIVVVGVALSFTIITVLVVDDSTQIPNEVYISKYLSFSYGNCGSWAAMFDANATYFTSLDMNNATITGSAAIESYCTALIQKLHLMDHFTNYATEVTISGVTKLAISWTFTIQEDGNKNTLEAIAVLSVNSDFNILDSENYFMGSIT